MRSPRQLVSAAAALGLLAVGGPAAAASSAAAGDLSPFVGTWTINLDRSTMNRAGPSGVQTRRAASFTWRFTPAADGLVMEIFPEFPAPRPAKVLPIRPDGRQHVCPMQESCLSAPGDPKDQSYAFTRADARLLVRVFQIKGRETEVNVYAVAADGKTFVATSWNPETPEYQNVQVFERRP